MSCDWLNLGLQDPRITGSNDPITGTNDPDTSWFDLPLKSGSTIRLRGLPEFVSTRGGAYTFLPSLSAIRYLGSLMMSVAQTGRGSFGGPCKASFAFGSKTVLAT